MKGTILMQVVAALSTPEDAMALIEFLNKERIPSEIRTATEETGLDVTEVLVDDDQYDAACGAAEQWEANIREKAEARPRRRCAACNSPHLEQIADIDYEKTVTKIGTVLRCRDCGHLIAF